MAAAHSTRPLTGHFRHVNTGAESALVAIRRALDLLGRASSDWRNGGQSAEGALHWPVSVNLARRALREALGRSSRPGGRRTRPRSTMMHARASPGSTVCRRLSVGTGLRWRTAHSRRTLGPATRPAPLHSSEGKGTSWRSENLPSHPQPRPRRLRTWRVCRSLSAMCASLRACPTPVRSIS